MTKMPRIDMQATGRRIRELRLKNKLSAERLSDLLGFTSPRAVYRWQRGDMLPTLDNLIVLASIFGTSMDSIVVTDEATDGAAATHRER